MVAQMIFDNILNQKIPWPQVPDDMSYEAQDLINRCASIVLSYCFLLQLLPVVLTFCQFTLWNNL